MICAAITSSNEIEFHIEDKVKKLSDCHVAITKRNFNNPYDQCYCLFIGDDKQTIFLNRVN